MTAEELAAKAAAIKAEWQAKAAQGDLKAKKALRECYPEEYAEIDAAAAVLAKPGPPHWQDRDPGEEG